MPIIKPSWVRHSDTEGNFILLWWRAQISHNTQSSTRLCSFCTKWTIYPINGFIYFVGERKAFRKAKVSIQRNCINRTVDLCKMASKLHSVFDLLTTHLRYFDVSSPYSAQLCILNVNIIFAWARCRWPFDLIANFEDITFATQKHQHLRMCVCVYVLQSKISSQNTTWKWR